MKSRYIAGIFCLALLMASCGGKTNKETDSHSLHEHQHGEACNHDHGHEGHSHDHEGHDHGHGAESADEIVLSVENARAAGVKSEVIRPRAFSQVIPAGGQLLSAQRDEFTVVANIAGVVSFKQTITEGMEVNKGSMLVTLSSANMLDGDPAQRAKIAFQTAEREYERARKLVDSQIVSEKEFNLIRQEYENARINYEAVSKNQIAGGQGIVSPAKAFVKAVLVNEGDYVEVGQALVTLVKGARMQLRTEVSERYYKYLKEINTANFRTPYDDEVYSLSALNGKLVSYGRAAGESSYYIPVTFEFDNPGHLLSGSCVSAFLLGKPTEDVMVLPLTALTEEQGLYFVYLQLDDECYKKQTVTLGAENGKEVLVLSGISAGDRVVTQGAYHVKLATATNALPAHSHEH